MIALEPLDLQSGKPELPARTKPTGKQKQGEHRLHAANRADNLHTGPHNGALQFEVAHLRTVGGAFGRLHPRVLPSAYPARGLTDVVR